YEPRLFYKLTAPNNNNNNNNNKQKQKISLPSHRHSFHMSCVIVCICLAQRVALLEGVTLLEFVCHCGCGFKTLILAAWKSVFCQQSSDEDVELSAPLVPCFSGCRHVPDLMILD
ncbi:mCG146313, partial [Mus musculus]